ncbi:hypothetical protein GUJ93_ZPchr0011g28855 [Zizania palustris]|uniref:Uncharacterized protein n=1 Tax=Zizania palustris TaxID=103762 RepID=A0A8J5WFD2_ZIZPA|nr:hypothetical protein GUJ93_ZPchr0011g28855 [Zizania palustris]
MSYPYARYFHEVDEELMCNLIRLNVEALTRVTHAVLPGMVKCKRGAIVNIGLCSPSYVDQFSRCLAVEYKNKGIDVQCQMYLPDFFG